MIWSVARRAAVAAMALSLASCLGGCVEDVAAVSAAAPSSTRIAARPGVSPQGAPLAFASLEGAPDSVLSRFSRETFVASTKRDIVSVEPAGAAYFAKGYLAAYPVGGGTAFASVWDLYDKGRKRVQRVEDFVIVRGASADPWALADDRVLANLATRSIDNLAATLTNTPEAVAATGRGTIVATDTAPDAPLARPVANGFR